ncbi:MAG: hypothetical protein GTO63_12225, partial [Anaerolineae bacterium]|nr:hypothetical protein [Anaerolineae bacterium]NIN95663.1 hypothetical protein [Anaerolineae bacterium]NIQ78618.1 hypothetical protein [Anaerolineae bacterium]
RMMITGELEMRHVELLWKTLHAEHVDCETVRLSLCTPGGDFSAWAGIIDLLEPVRSAGQLVTIAVGEVCSGGVPILASGTPGRRGVYRHTMLGLHEPYLACTTDDPAVQASDMKLLDSMKARFYNLMAEYTRHRAKWWRDRLAAKSLIWIDAKQAVRWGIADKVLG